MRQQVEAQARRLIVDLDLKDNEKQTNEHISSRLGTQTQLMRSTYMGISHRKAQVSSYEELPKKGSYIVPYSPQISIVSTVNNSQRLIQFDPSSMQQDQEVGAKRKRSYIQNYKLNSLAQGSVKYAQKRSSQDTRLSQKTLNQLQHKSLLTFQRIDK